MTAEVKSTETAGTLAGGAHVPNHARETVPGRCNAPQRTPVAPATPWGQPRADRGWSLRELAMRSGVSAGEISKIERGIGCPTPNQARGLILAFDLPGDLPGDLPTGGHRYRIQCEDCGHPGTIRLSIEP